ncbi:nuclear transport factor 2 family protein [Streptomyces sp. NBC_01433]|uniref:nuclear transport factor 2 family protein n=1 Tax=Streptomyces sp. NBC_01433 TaxID=2903864 RepID=UPI00224D12F9|nr:nuclear transport factor 2 family protein [Streptomyces sp. NBC_01433]MCX4680652.1 nuclear transport factor 2 family protein [Streptomyces sp. NBC_01433]
MEQTISETAIRFLRRLEVYDFADAQAMCTEKATVWQNDGKGEQTIDERLRQFSSFAATVDSLRFDVIRQFRDANELLLQYILHLVTADGSRSEVHAVVHFRFEGGLIDRIEENIYTVPEEKDA